MTFGIGEVFAWAVAAWLAGIILGYMIGIE